MITENIVKNIVNIGVTNPSVRIYANLKGNKIAYIDITTLHINGEIVTLNEDTKVPVSDITRIDISL